MVGGATVRDLPSEVLILILTGTTDATPAWFSNVSVFGMGVHLTKHVLHQSLRSDSLLSFDRGCHLIAVVM